MPTKLKIRLYPDPCLRKASSVISEVGAGERQLIEAMIATMYEHKGVGLAAAQVGINEQIFVADIGDGPLAFINPVITKNGELETLEEGCLSIPGVMVQVKRPKKIKVKYINVNNELVEAQYTDLLARVIQHETDHLHGKLITDYASDAEKEKIKPQLEELEKQNKS